MFDFKGKKGIAQDLSTVLGAVAPKDFGSLANMRLATKICDKLEAGCASLREEGAKLDEQVKAVREKFAATDDEDERKALTAEADTIAKPIVERINALREEPCEAVELSDEQAKWLRDSFEKLVMPGFRTAKYALEVAEAIGVEEK